MTIRVVVADDETLLRSAFRVLIGIESDLELVGEAADGAEAVAVATATRPDVVVMDIRMPVMNGLEATRLLVRGKTGEPRVLILTTFDLDEYVFEALAAGASGFLLKNRPLEELLEAIRVIASGEALLAPSVTKRLVAHYARYHPNIVVTPEALDALTSREREVLVLVAQGLSNTEIADRLAMSMATAKTHVSRILAKLPARDRAQLVVIAYECGLVTAG
jgi:DNA-binding NarL/FixJ family response regulator